MMRYLAALLCITVMAGCSMLDLSTKAKFEAENKKGTKTRAAIVQLQDVVLEEEKTLQAHWSANTDESNVDYTPSPPNAGDVILDRPFTWGGLTSGATTRAWHSAIEYQGKIYIFGGFDSSVRVNTLWEYDIAGDSWTQLTSGATARFKHSAIEYNGKMYIFGGINTGIEFNDLWEYDIAGDSWTQLTSGASIRKEHSAIEFDGKMYIFGGQFSATEYNDVWEYDIAGDSWSQKTSGSTTRFAHSAIEADGKMYIFGGLHPPNYLNDVWEYDISLDSWAQKTSGASLRISHSAIEFNFKMYVFGGFNGSTYFNDVWEYDIGQDIWIQKTSGASIRAAHRAIEFEGEMYVFGGFNDPDYLNDIYANHIGHYDTGYLTTDNFNLGTTPTVPGEWQMQDTKPDGTSLTYEAWSSPTGAFTGEETALGIVADGDSIIVLEDYYRVKPSFTTNTARDKTATLHSIKADFSTYIDVIAHAAPGSLSGLESIGTLSTEISDFKPTTISSMTITFPFNKRISTWFATRYPKNRIAKVKYGFIAPGFTPADYIDRFFGQIEDWKISSSGKVTVTIYSFHKEWKTQIPAKWVDAGDDQEWIEEHPVNVILDILQNFLTVRDSKINYASFYAVRDALPGWKVTRKITENTEEAKAMMEELRGLMTCYFTLHGDGSVGLKRWDANETPVATLTDKDFLPPGPSWAANAKGLINEVFIYFAHGEDGAGNYTTPAAGDEAVNFRGLGTDFDGNSIDNWQEVAPKTLKDKWTRSTEATQVTTRVAVTLDRYKDPRSLLSVSLSGKWIALETGDIVNITTKRYPSTDFAGCTDKPFQIVKMTPNWLKKSGSEISLVLLEV